MSQPVPRGSPSLPPGIANAYWFTTFNALSFQIVLGSPMVLYAKRLGASATVLGLVAGMMPLLVMFQIPAARHIGRIGYKRFVYAGWGTRVAMIFVMALVPLSGFVLDKATQLILMLCLLFAFNLSRGISSAAWLPWITSIVPVEIRGHYLTMDAVCMHLASFATLCLAGLCLWREPQTWHFAALFGWSALNGAISLRFLKQIPEGVVPEHERTSKEPVPWKDIAGYEPFRKLLRMQLLWAIAYGGVTTFTVSYLRASAGLGEGPILCLTGAAFLGGLAGLWIFGSHTDDFGSKPVVSICLILWLVVMAIWVALAAGLLHAGTVLILFLELAMGLAFALVNMNNTRLAMVLAPQMGRSHFFALFSVVQNVVLGLAPVGWGFLIDCVGTRTWTFNNFEVNRYSLFFLLATVCFGATLYLTHKIVEPKARQMDELVKELLVQSPIRDWLRVWWK